MSEEKLPYRVLTNAAQMLGGSSGFSYAEMSDFSCHALNKLPTELGPIGGSNRPEGVQVVALAVSGFTAEATSAATLSQQLPDVARPKAGSMASFLLARFETRQ
jgi:hypothetical protein